MMRRILFSRAGFALLVLSPLTQAVNPAEVDYLVQRALAAQSAMFVSYSVDDDGRAHVLFGSNEPAWRVEKTVKALQSHPGIPGLVWTQLDSELCPVR